MKNFYIFIIGISICSSAFAETEIYIYTDYKPVRILNLRAGQNQEVEASKAGLSGAFKKVLDSEIPKDKSDRNAWVWEDGKIKVDQKKKQEVDAKKNSRKSGLKKLKDLGLTDEELLELRIKSGGD